MPQIRLVLFRKAGGNKIALTWKYVHTLWDQLDWLQPSSQGWIGVIATCFILRASYAVAGMAGGKHKLRSFANNQELAFQGGIKSPWLRVTRSKQNCGKLVSAWHILVAGSCLCHIKEMSQGQNLTSSVPWHKKSFYFKEREPWIQYLYTSKYSSF